MTLFDYHNINFVKLDKSQGYNVFVSEYDMPLDFKCIFEKEHIKKIGVQNNLKSIERLYIL